MSIKTKIALVILLTVLALATGIGFILAFTASFDTVTAIKQLLGLTPREQESATAPSVPEPAPPTAFPQPPSQTDISPPSQTPTPPATATPSPPPSAQKKILGPFRGTEVKPCPSHYHHTRIICAETDPPRCTWYCQYTPDPLSPAHMQEKLCAAGQAPKTLTCRDDDARLCTWQCAEPGGRIIVCSTEKEFAAAIPQTSPTGWWCRIGYAGRFPQYGDNSSAAASSVIYECRGAVCQKIK
jgi:hypothetical protein